MKVYRSNNEDNSKKRMSKRGIIAMGTSACLVMAAVAVTLILTLTAPIDNPDDKLPIDGTVTFVMPVDTVELGMIFSNEKLVKHKTSGFWQTHEGVDFLVEAGTQIMAISDGTVLSVELNTIMEGTVIKIQHANGVVSIYKGLNEASVTAGASVKAGAIIGTIGSINVESREYSKPHLHMEVTLNGVRVDPANYLNELGDK